MLTAAGLAQSALAAALLGAGDFAGGLASRTRAATSITAAVQAVGAIGMVAVVLAVRPDGPPTSSIFLGVVAGLAASVALASLYRGLAMTTMGVVAAISASGSVAIPVVFGMVVLGDAPSLLQWLGIGCAIAAAAAAGGLSRMAIPPLALAFGAIAALGFGAYFLALSSGIRDGLWVLAISRVTGAVTMTMLALASRASAPGLRDLRLVAFAGVADLAGNLLILSALTTLPIGIVAAISGTYPVATAVSAWIMLGQRLGTTGMASISLAVLGIALIGQR